MIILTYILKKFASVRDRFLDESNNRLVRSKFNVLCTFCSVLGRAFEHVAEEAQIVVERENFDSNSELFRFWPWRLYFSFMLFQ